MDALVTNLYELKMGQYYFSNGMTNTIAYFDVFFRKAPDGASFAIANGTQKVIDYILNYHFEKSDIEYLKSLDMFDDKFLNYLSSLKFTGDIYSVADGTVVFANEPVMTIRAPIIEAQLLETAILQMFNYASLITTKASRIARAAGKCGVYEIGCKRAQNVESALLGSLYSYEAGCVGTSNIETSKEFGIPTINTMGHSFVQCFESEFEAFKASAKANPDNCVLVLDTFNVLESGIINAIKINEKVLKPMGKSVKAVQIDSGDLAYLAKEVRFKLDQAGMKSTKIILSNAIDEFVIESLIQQRTPVDYFAVGEKLVTSMSSPSLGGVYKLVAVEKKGIIIPKLKITENLSKITLPDYKKVYRLYDENKKIIADMICSANEKKPSGKIKINDSDRPWMIKEINNYTTRELLFKFVQNGKRMLKNLTPVQVRKNIAYEISTLSPEATRLHNPQTYVVNISHNLQNTKESLLQKRYK